MSTTEITTQASTEAVEADTEVHLTRRGIDKVLIALGGVGAVFLLVAGGLLMWGSNFASDYVGKELRSQNISFPTADASTTEGRTDLVGFAGQHVTTGAEAASLRQLHQRAPPSRRRRPDLRRPGHPAARRHRGGHRGQGCRSAASRHRRAASQGHGDLRPARHLLKGETLRGLLLSAYAWSTVGRIAGIAAWVAFAAGAVMIVLVVLGIVHERRVREGVDHGVTAHPISQPAGAPACRRGSCASELGPDTDRRRVDVRWAAAPGDHRRCGTRRPRRGRGRRRRRSHPPRRGDRAFHRSPQHRARRRRADRRRLAPGRTSRRRH